MWQSYANTQAEKKTLKVSVWEKDSEQLSCCNPSPLSYKLFRGKGLGDKELSSLRAAAFGSWR